MNLFLPFLKYPKLQGSDEGVGSVYHSALLRFPLDYSSFVQFSAALAESTPTSAERASCLTSNETYMYINAQDALGTSQM